MYLLDSDTLIQAANKFYRFDTWLVFWNWLEQQNKQHVIFSIYAVEKELMEFKDDDRLKYWAKQQGAKFFLRPDQRVLRACSKIADWYKIVHASTTPPKTSFLAMPTFGW